MADITTEREITVADGLGNAKPEHVLAGTTFSSEDGFNQEGTLSLEDPLLQKHIADMNNPHSVTKSQVGLGNVDNTSDINKPVSGPQQAALNALQTEITSELRETTQALEKEVAITDIATGEHITVTNSTDASVRKLKIDGRTDQITTNGYQLFDASRISTTTQSGATVTNNGDGSFTISGNGKLIENTFDRTYEIQREYALSLFKVGNIYLKNDISYPYFFAMFKGTDNKTYFTLSSRNESSTKSGTITQEMLDDENFKVRIGFYASSGENMSITTGTVKPMLYQDGDGTWEPFTGGVATPNQNYRQEITGIGESGKVDVTVTGKNLFGGDAFADKLVEVAKGKKSESDKTIEFICEDSSGKELFNNFKENTQYTFIYYGMCKNIVENHVNLIFEYTDGSKVHCKFEKINENSYCRIVSDEGKTISNIKGTWGSVGTILHYDKCGIFEGAVELKDFEPYKSQTLSIPVSTPLYADDTATIKDGKIEIVRNDIKFTYDGSNASWWQKAADSHHTENSTLFYRETTPLKEFGRTNFLCDSFTVYDSVIGSNYDFEGICGNQANTYLYLRINGQMTLDEFKTWITENPITVVYPKITQTTETIETDIDLSTYYHVTNVTNSDNANMEVEYFINNRHADVVTEIHRKMDVLGDDLDAYKEEVQGNFTNVETKINAKAPLASPKFTGTVETMGDMKATDSQGNKVSLLALPELIKMYHIIETDVQILGGGGGSFTRDLNYEQYYPILATITQIDGAAVIIKQCKIINDGYNNYSLNVLIENITDYEANGTVHIDVLYLRKFM